MKIRSVTCFVNASKNGLIDSNQLDKLSSFNSKIKSIFGDSGYELQSLRCATNPFPEYMAENSVKKAVKIAQQLEKEFFGIGFVYISIGTVGTDHLELYPWIPEILAATDNVFATAQMVSQSDREISIVAIKAIASIMRKLSTLDANGFGNLYFAALAKVPGGIPFLPAAYKASSDDRLSFALAMESADLAMTAFSSAQTVKEAGMIYRQLIEKKAEELHKLVVKIGKENDISFLGFDFTPAPFILAESSVGNALEKLSGKPVGELSSVSTAAFLMSILDSANFKRSGFNGLMLPVLEDSILAQRAAEGKLTLKDLLLYSTVCGTGLDTVPLPGDITEQQLQSILLDVASLAVRLNKPLTARLMPIPGKKAGEMTSFDFPFFTNSKVMSPECSGLSGIFSNSESLFLNPRN